MSKVIAVTTTLAAVAMLAAPALADGKHTLVMKSDGNADAKVRAQIDAAILKLARGGVEGVAAGDISFNDAAAAIGCAKPDAPSCATDVLGMLSVDEVVATTVTRKPGGLEIVVRRATKAGAPREIIAKVADANDPQLDAQVGQLFGAAATTPPKPLEPPVATTTVITPPPDTTLPTDPPTTTDPNPATAVPPLPPPHDAEDQQHTRLEMAGMIGGGGLLLLGFVMWGQASGTQSDIDAAPNRTVANLQHIQDLEKQGDSQAALGNVLFIGGVALAAVSTYFFIRDRGRRHDPVARITPTVFPHGAGIALTFGGSP